MDPKLLEYRSYFSYFFDHGRGVKTVRRAVGYVRRGLLVSRIIRYTAAAVALLETSTVLLALALFLLLLTPLLLLPWVLVRLIGNICHASEMREAASCFSGDARPILCFAPAGRVMIRSVQETGRKLISVSSVRQSLFFCPPARKTREGYTLSLFYFYRLYRRMGSDPASHRLYAVF